MPIYKVKYTEHHQVNSIATDEFDTSDESKWEWLKNAVRDQYDGDIDELPEKPPSDPHQWVELYRLLHKGEYSDIYDDWVTDRKGGYDTSLMVTGPKNKIIVDE